MKSVKASSLVLDFDLYPRPDIDSQHVAEMVEALELGVEFPPIVFDQKSKRVTDGFHRVRAHLRHFGEDSEINGIAKRYRSEADLLKDAIAYNAGHGRKLTANDRARCLILAERVGLSLDELAGALHCTVDKLGKVETRKIARTNGTKVALKNTIAHKAGTKITKEQVAANKKLGGMNQLFYVNQVILLIENDLVDKDNEELKDRMAHLKKIL